MRTPVTLPAGSVAATAASAALRAASAVIAGFALTAGMALVLWAVTPSTPADVSDAADAIRGGAVAFAAAHFLPVSISGTALTLRPLLATALAVAVIATAVGRGRSVRGRALEALHASVFVLLYAVGVDLLVAATAPSGAAQPGLGAPLVLAALTALGSLIARPTAWRAWWMRTVPAYLTVAVRAAAVTVMGLICAAALVLAMGIAVSFPQAAGIAELTIHSFGDALGMALVCLAFLPNAILAALGYLSGAGFSIGAGSFSPLDVHGAELPAVPLLAAVPSGQPSAVNWIVFAAPVLAGLLAAWVLRRVGESRGQRAMAVLVTAVVTGLGCALLTSAGGGGIAGGPWASMGAPPWTTGGLIAAIVLMVAASIALPPGWAGLPWRVGDPRRRRDAVGPAERADDAGDRAVSGDDAGADDAGAGDAGAGDAGADDAGAGDVGAGDAGTGDIGTDDGGAAGPAPDERAQTADAVIPDRGPGGSDEAVSEPVGAVIDDQARTPAVDDEPGDEVEREADPGPDRETAPEPDREADHEAGADDDAETKPAG